MFSKIKMVCGNCMDFDKAKGQCTIRYTILPDKTKVPMSRKPDSHGCKVFMYAI